MVAVDTNVLVRLLTRDDEPQFHKAHKLFRDHDVHVSKTVILETEWVLRYAYGFPPDEIAEALEGLAGLDRVVLEAGAQVVEAIGWLREGLDFADALHLATTPSTAEAFATFDKKLANRAPAGSVTVRQL